MIFAYFRHSPVKRLLFILCVLISGYAGGRLYFSLTDGFALEHIASEYAYDARWDARPLTAQEQLSVDAILSQPFHYLGKGYQFYAFLSQDGTHVLKFFKYKRLRESSWGEYFGFIPMLEDYFLKKNLEKRKKLEGVFSSCKVAFDQLKKETGLLFVHLNKTDTLNRSVVLVDKIGKTYSVDLDKTEFLLQKKADLLGPYLDQLMEAGKTAEAKELLARIIDVILSEYSRGLSDNDHALLPNTGVIAGHPIHVDVGQFVLNEEVKQSEVSKQELFSKTYKLNQWLKSQYPELSQYLEAELRSIIGEQFASYRPSGLNLSGHPQFGNL